MGPGLRSTGRRVAAAGATAVGAALWAGLAGVVVVLASIVVGVSGPAVLIAAQGMVPLYVVAVPGAGVVAGLLRRPGLAGVSGAATLAVLAAAMGPATADGPPRWADGAPRLVVFSANVRYDNPWPDRVAAAVAAADADVVVLNEVTRPLIRELGRAGVLGRYPVRAVSAMDGGFGELVMARRGATEARVEALGPLNVPALTVVAAGRRVRVLAVHPQAPSEGWAIDRWTAQFAALATRSAARPGPLVLLGDFNATSWHEPFRALLDTGLTDAHDARGHGLSRSWGLLVDVDLRLVPLLRIDHALASSELAAVSVSDDSVPGSDHRSQRVVYAVRPA